MIDVYFDKPSTIPCKKDLLSEQDHPTNSTPEDCDVSNDPVETTNFVKNAWTYLDFIDSYFSRIESGYPTIALLMRIVRAGAIITRQLLCADAAFGSLLGISDFITPTHEKLLFWFGFPLYLASGTLRDPIGDAHRLLFALEIVCGRGLQKYGTLTPILLLSLPYFYRSIWVNNNAHYDILAGNGDAGDLTTPINDSLIWPILGKFLNQHVLSRLPYYSNLLDSCTRTPEEALWFGNIFGCFLLLILKDSLMWMIMRSDRIRGHIGM
ncbi:HER140Cp [Eremothecium sinecaudum]|uniref:HER140Cp n=1 Tax=Eremothecium sinecaudum TaxID=45286 RepID=A0A0X8HTX4_9SACH|nr:HER140Cp [Eremothecium sinecaudum]AMD21419.1 HER140Cp [Eremothecium sinecaudum]